MPSRERRIFSDLAFRAQGAGAAERGEHGGRRMAWAVLVLSFAATLTIWWMTSGVVQRESSERFASRVSEVHASIQDRMRSYAQVLRAASALFKASGTVTRSEWENFIRGLELDRFYPGIPAVAYARAVPQPTLDDLVDEMRADGVPEFAVRPPGVRPEYLINIYAAPFNALNRAALGYDMLSEPVRRATIRHAVETGQPAITPRLILKIDEHRDPQPAFIMYFPTYDASRPQTTVEERRAALTGTVLAPFRVYPLVEGILGNDFGDIGLTIYDGTETGDDHEMYRSNADTPREPLHRVLRQVPFQDRIWTIAYYSTPGFEAALHNDKPGLILGAGAIISLLVFAMAWSLSSNRARAAKLAAEMTESLRRRESELHQFFTQAPVGICILDAEGRVIDCNPVMGQYMGVPADAIIGFNMLTDAKDRSFTFAVERALGGEPSEIETPYVSTLGGRQGFYHAHFQPIFNGPDFLFVLGFIDDVSERKAAEDQVHYLAHFDALTALPNRTLLADRLTHAIALARRTETTIAVLFLDLDHFKVINDSLGHTVGDDVLKEVAERLRESVRESDTVARHGGDEFVVVLTDAGEAKDVATVAGQIIERLNAPMRIKGREFSISPSIGISMFPEDGDDGERLIKNADAALYQAKSAGRRAFRFFTNALDVQLNERLTVEASIRRALDLGEFRLHYQPQIDIATGGVIGLEGLIRWAHPDLGMVPPNRFIPIAEESGQITAISQWVMDEACRQMKQWQNSGITVQRVAVNISALQFRTPDLPDQVEAVLARHGLPAGCLEIEVTEGALIHNLETATRILRALKTIGVKVSIDDFGTGYSSLSYLQRFPVDTLKIDRSFVGELGSDPHNAAIVRAIISLGKSLNLTIIAEGVETDQQLGLLRTEGCHAAQGYVYSRPLPPDEVARFLRGRASVAAE
ncbi:diguanylate cyclase (GGDEF)-like protein/PAS domain S-box-containing protein [Azospirillum fermentarium]|uniref:bifunctional diguanylate cyclase/phosphodiesterase n=1 Tax=Azospirillum fermentarium TaxID=1233114 RepID=UPI002227C8EE|nr:EAL domain-containing protein [Azospirillum fermentarium]MCW2244666.1 diguanylate cyclase (GGDEF)-like protein/PAS domain S-box-containing protein [Azospirillum fermentarium]